MDPHTKNNTSTYTCSLRETKSYLAAQLVAQTEWILKNHEEPRKTNSSNLQASYPAQPTRWTAKNGEILRTRTYTTAGSQLPSIGSSCYSQQDDHQSKVFVSGGGRSAAPILALPCRAEAASLLPVRGESRRPVRRFASSLGRLRATSSCARALCLFAFWLHNATWLLEKNNDTETTHFEAG